MPQSPSQPPRSSRSGATLRLPLDKVMGQRCMAWGSALAIGSVAAHFALLPVVAPEGSRLAAGGALCWQSMCLSAIFAAVLVGLAVSSVGLMAAAWGMWRHHSAVRSCAAGGALVVGAFLILRLRAGGLTGVPAVGLAGVVAAIFYASSSRSLPACCADRAGSARAFLLRGLVSLVLLAGLVHVLSEPGRVRSAGLGATPELLLFRQLDQGMAAAPQHASRDGAEGR